MQTFVKDSQNPYRTGVLVGNHTEDRFGQELSQVQVDLLLLSNLCSVLERAQDSNYRAAEKLPSWQFHESL